jgi:hypothetical protein
MTRAGSAVKNERPRPRSAKLGRLTIRVIGLNCEHCGRSAQAADFDIDDRRVGLVCQGCHRDRLSIEDEG